MGMHHIINGFNGGLSRDERLSNLCGPLHSARGALSPLNTRLVRAALSMKLACRIYPPSPLIAYSWRANANTSQEKSSTRIGK